MREYTEKYKIQITSEHINEVNNQPEWRIEEYTKIFLKMDWLIAPITPMRHEKIMINLIKLIFE